jgi:hypothetical protein
MAVSFIPAGMIPELKNSFTAFMISSFKVEHLVSPRSDHCPILVSFNSPPATKPIRPCRRYEAYWERELSLGEEMKGAWKGQKTAQNLEDISNKLDCLMDTLQDWSKRTIGSVPKR